MAQTIPCPLAVARFISRFDQFLREKGLLLSCSTDFQAFESLCSELPGKGEASEFFSLRHFDFSPSEAFWLQACDEDGKTVHVQAMRVDHLHGMSLADHWQQRFRRLYLEPQQGVAWDGRTARIAEEISGTVVYHGELWVRRNGLRRIGLSGPLAHIALGLALSKWNPDWVYGFVDHALVERGFTIREGYSHVERWAAGWIVAPNGVEPDESIVWMHREDLISMTQRLVEQRPSSPDNAR